LQAYSVVLANAVLKRQAAFDASTAWESWLRDAKGLLAYRKIPQSHMLTKQLVAELRAWSASHVAAPIVCAYGGHYFHPRQALWLDRLRMSLPKDEPVRTVALASLVDAASSVAASPGHTAQPFRLKRSSKVYITEMWGRDVVSVVKSSFERLAKTFAKKPGYAIIQDANAFANSLDKDDLAFVDPPYAGVQYSRFYHVLEALVRGGPFGVQGAGRYPGLDFRPQSDYSKKSKASKAMAELLSTIARRRARAILTFPDRQCSNGLSGEMIKEQASAYFHAVPKYVDSRFSTLGGTNSRSESGKVRGSRQHAKEMILLLSPR
jgi:adenine-specific DNA-methyltransferase